VASRRAGDGIRGCIRRWFGLRFSVLLSAATWRAADVGRKPTQRPLEVLHREAARESANQTGDDVRTRSAIH
jgi:hypothetical protein